MELNAKITSLEDEVKLLKGEVKLILSEIRTAILGQTNPFSNEGALPLRANPDALDSRPPIRVVKAAEEDTEEAQMASPNEDYAQDLSWADEEEPLLQPVNEAPPPAPERPAAASPPPQRPKKAEEPPAQPEPAAPPAAREAYPAPTPISTLADHPRWSLIKVAGLTVWAEEALKQVGPERLQILLDLCEFAGYLPASAKEALMRVMNLGLVIDERTTAPSVNECLVVLYQLDALMRGEDPGGVLRGSLTA